jgi:hypothetical protein
VAIAATFIREKGDWLLTGNKKHFDIIPGVILRKIGFLFVNVH